MKKLALRSALSDLAAEGSILALEAWPFEDSASTKKAVALFKSIGVAGHKVLAVVDEMEDLAALSVRNLAWAKPIRADQINTYDVVDAEYLVADVGVLGRLAGGELDVTKDSASADEAAEAEETSEQDDGEDDS